jgi:hypothetical protein
MSVVFVVDPPPVVSDPYKAVGRPSAPPASEVGCLPACQIGDRAMSPVVTASDVP